MGWLASHDELQPELFVDYFSSSTPLMGLPVRFKLFVDTNTFAYREATLRAAMDVGIGKIPHGPFFEQYGINVVLLHCGPDTQALVTAMTRDDGHWALVHVDQAAVVFVRRIPAHVRTILVESVSEDRVDVTRWIAALHGPEAARAMAIGAAASVPISLGGGRRGGGAVRRGGEAAGRTMSRRGLISACAAATWPMLRRGAGGETRR
ncbi:MAG: hypothetical protein IPK83_18265 [Planctomycetes bacterium]|nr:hypothetical protein [Planctomycetota bacterium]